MADTFAPATLPHATTSRLSHRSIDWAPLFSLDPRRVVPIPLHITMGVTTRLLRLAVELIISCRGRAVGLPYAYELAETLRTSVRVSPAPYRGGVLIGRACHTIAEGGDAVCRTLLCLVPERDHVAYKRLWALWRKLVRTLNRAVDVSLAEVRDIRSCADLFVRHLKLCFPWVSLSPKLHILFRHAADFLSRFGSIGIFGEQSIEASHGFCNQNAVKFSAETEADGCAKLGRAMATAREASDASLVRSTRRPTKDGARRARKATDRRLNVNRGGADECRAPREKAIREGRQWAQSILAEGDRTFATFLARFERGG